MKNPFSLEGKTILVTGASSGIGKATAIACAEQGARVVINGRNVARLNETLRTIGDLKLDNGESHIVIPADLTIAEQRQVLAEQVPELDGVVQCAGIGNRTLCKMIGEEDVREVMSPNMEAPILLQSELLQAKKIKKGASIVFVASAAATMPAMGNALYSASKGAILSYARCLALELASRKIRVNCISSAMVWTNLALVGATEEQLREAEQNYPLKRYGQPADVANLAVYMLSEAARWMTGSNVEITGGTSKL